MDYRETLEILGSPNFFLKSCYNRPSSFLLLSLYTILLNYVPFTPFILVLVNILHALFYKDMISLAALSRFFPRLFITMPGVTLSWRIPVLRDVNIPRFCAILYNDGGFIYDRKSFQRCASCCAVNSDIKMSHGSSHLKLHFLILLLYLYGQYSSINIRSGCLQSGTRQGIDRQSKFLASGFSAFCKFIFRLWPIFATQPL